jgi:hypothetical protein
MIFSNVKKIEKKEEPKIKYSKIKSAVHSCELNKDSDDCKNKLKELNIQIED